MGKELTLKYVHLTPEEAGKALAAGYKKVMGEDPPANILALLISQSALETGNWKKLPNYNMAGIKATDSSPYFQYFTCSEVKDGVKTYYEPPNPMCKFAAYKTAADGAASYVRTLTRRAHWLEGLKGGTIDTFIDGLATFPAYFTADKDEYKTTMRDRYDGFIAVANKYGTGDATMTGEFSEDEFSQLVESQFADE
jgi:hypothetical protein